MIAKSPRDHQMANRNQDMFHFLITLHLAIQCQASQSELFRINQINQIARVYISVHYAGPSLPQPFSIHSSKQPDLYPLPLTQSKSSSNRMFPQRTSHSYLPGFPTCTRESPILLSQCQNARVNRTSRLHSVHTCTAPS